MAGLFHKIVPFIRYFKSFLIPVHTEPNITGVWQTDDRRKVTLRIYILKPGTLQVRIIHNPSNSTNDDTIFIRKLRFDSREKSFKGNFFSSNHEKVCEVQITLVKEGKLKVVNHQSTVSITNYLIKIL